MNRILVIGLFFCFSQLVFSQTFSVQQVQEDGEALIAGVNTYNPFVEQYQPQFNEQAKALLAAVEGEIGLYEYYGLMCKIGSLSQEGHFRVDTKQVFDKMKEEEFRSLPVSIEIIGDQLYIDRYFTAEELFKPYDQVVSINGQNTADVLAQLYPYIPADADIQTYKRFKLNNGFAWFYYVFIDQPEQFELEVKSLGQEEVRKVKLEALSRPVQVEHFKKRYPKKEGDEKVDSIDDFYELKIEENHAYLWLKSFDYRLVEKYELKADKLYEEIFTKINQAKVPNLIVDLRNNTGGRIKFASEIIPYIWQEGNDEFMKKSVSWKGKTKNFKVPKQSKIAFKGSIYVLVNGGTFSAGGSIARYLKEYGQATVIGEETGARYEGYVAGSSEDIILPNAGMKVFIPRYQTYFPPSRKQEAKNRGLIPDITVVPSPKSRSLKQDDVLETLMKRIQK